MVDFVGKFENINHDFSHILKTINIESELVNKNRSNRKNYTNYYKSQEMIDKIAYLYAKDIELFHYEFEGINNYES